MKQEELNPSLTASYPPFCNFLKRRIDSDLSLPYESLAADPKAIEQTDERMPGHPPTRLAIPKKKKGIGQVLLCRFSLLHLPMDFTSL